jgi:FixJ family two-component response regulator
MPVILSSGFSAHGAAEDLLAAGAAVFTAKPYTTQELCRVVRETCDRFARRQARRSHSATSE